MKNRKNNKFRQFFVARSRIVHNKERRENALLFLKVMESPGKRKLYTNRSTIKQNAVYLRTAAGYLNKQMQRSYKNRIINKMY